MWKYFFFIMKIFFQWKLSVLEITGVVMISTSKIFFTTIKERDNGVTSTIYQPGQWASCKRKANLFSSHPYIYVLCYDCLIVLLNYNYASSVLHFDFFDLKQKRKQNVWKPVPHILCTLSCKNQLCPAFFEAAANSETFCFKPTFPLLAQWKPHLETWRPSQESWQNR